MSDALGRPPARPPHRARSLLLAVAGLVAAVAARAAAAPDPGPPAPAGGPAALSLEACIGYALEHSPELQKLRLSHTSQTLQTIIERAAFHPKLEASTAYDVDPERHSQRLAVSQNTVAGVKLTGTVAASEQPDSSGEDSASLSVRVSKKILGGDSWREMRNGIDESEVNEVIALNNLSRQRRNLVADVRQRFYQVIRDIQSLTVQERSLERARRNLENAIEREKPLDIITARTQIPDNELAVLSAKRAIDTGLDSLKVLIGMPAAEPLRIEESFEFRFVEPDVRRDLQLALENHESFLNSALERRKLDWRVEIARRHLWPDVTLAFTHTQPSDGTGLNLQGESDQNLSLGLSWDLGRKADQAAYARALNAVRTQELDRFILVQAKTQRLTDLDRQLRERAENIRLQEQKIELLVRQVELYSDRWENGEIDILEFVRSQNTLENGRVDLIKLRAGYMEMVAEYEFEVGR